EAWRRNLPTKPDLRPRNNDGQIAKRLRPKGRGHWCFLLHVSCFAFSATTNQSGSASEIISPLLGDAKYSDLSSPRCSRGARRCVGKSARRKWLASRCSARPGHSWPKVRTSPDRAEKRW